MKSNLSATLISEINEKKVLMKGSASQLQQLISYFRSID